MTDVVRYKGCDCAGTSSGPRDVFIVWHDDEYRRTRMRLTRVAFACDVCDEPWSDWMPPPPALSACPP